MTRETKRQAIEIRKYQVQRLIRIWAKILETGAPFDKFFRVARLCNMTVVEIYHIATQPIPRFPLGSPHPGGPAIVGAADRPEVVISRSGFVAVQNPIRSLPSDSKVLPDIEQLLKNLQP